MKRWKSKGRYRSRGRVGRRRRSYGRRSGSRRVGRRSPGRIGYRL